MMNITLVEDEPMVAKRLARFFDQCTDDKTTIHRFSNLDDAEEHLSNRDTDLLFLDLNLHGKDGFSLIHQQLAAPYHTVVVSANTDRALEAFELGVLDFIGKPFTQERISKAMERFSLHQFKGQCQRLSYRKNNVLCFLQVDDIQFIQAAGHYSEITTKDNQTILHDKHLDRLMQILPQGFMRVHRSYALPLDEVKHIEQHSGAKYIAHLHSGASVPVGRTKFSTLVDALGQ